MVGDELCEILEIPWEHEPRVIRQSGKWPIRKTLAFAQVADVVIGPETGVMNAVAFETVPKILFLSHSSVNNLSRDWVNCYDMIPEDTECYPCHMIHHGSEWCHRVEKEGDPADGTALCQANISADRVWQALDSILKEVANRRGEWQQAVA